MTKLFDNCAIALDNGFFTPYFTRKLKWVFIYDWLWELVLYIKIDKISNQVLSNEFIKTQLDKVSNFKKYFKLIFISYNYLIRVYKQT